MSIPPWEPDRPLTQETASALVKTQFPFIDAAELTHLGSGWEFDAFLTIDRWVFRFPRRAECADLFELERWVHQLVSTVLPPTIAVPRVELVGQPALGFPYRFAGHRFIRGVAADGVGSEHMPALARALGAALGAIHSIPEDVARTAGVREMQLDDVGRQQWLARGREIAAGLRALDPAVDEAVSWLERVSLPFTEFDGPLRLIHHDLSPEHVLADPETGDLTGILDWTDAILGDPARDFVFLVTWQGWAFVEDLVRSYPHPVDRSFRERLRFMARLLSIMWLAMAFEQQADTGKHVDGVRNAFAANPPWP